MGRVGQLLRQPLLVIEQSKSEVVRRRQTSAAPVANIIQLQIGRNSLRRRNAAVMLKAERRRVVMTFMDGLARLAFEEAI